VSHHTHQATSRNMTLEANSTSACQLNELFYSPIECLKVHDIGTMEAVNLRAKPVHRVLAAPWDA
jgi:hypothetical protein